MNGHTHALFGVATVTLANSIHPFIAPHLWQDVPTGATLALSAGIIGALLPDIDANESSIKHEMGLAGSVISGGLHLFGVKHRGMTHTGLAAAVIWLAAAIIGKHFDFPDIGLAFGLGYASHLIADGMTLTGIPLLTPFYRKNIHLLPKPLRVRTGSAVESLVFLLVALGLAGLLPKTFAPETQWLRQWLSLVGK